jgi:hypothetical protein
MEAIRSELLIDMHLDLLSLLIKCKDANLISEIDALQIHQKYAHLSHILIELSLSSSPLSASPISPCLDKLCERALQN